MRAISIPIIYGVITFLLCVVVISLVAAFAVNYFPDWLKPFTPLIALMPSAIVAGKVTSDKTNTSYKSRKIVLSAIVGYFCFTSILLFPGYSINLWWLNFCIGLFGSVLAIMGALIGSFKSYVF